jgi:hypothetical protein
MSDGREQSPRRQGLGGKRGFLRFQKAFVVPISGQGLGSGPKSKGIHANEPTERLATTCGRPDTLIPACRARPPFVTPRSRLGDQIIYQLHMLKRTHANGVARSIQKRAHTAISDLEAIRTAKEKLHHSAPPTASGFSLRKEGREIYRWFRTDPDSATQR